ncbi:TonB-dependent receptor [Pelagicoccus sp. SDUM812003]|uniref:TonB-dependent receptor domain-containing protein n=1 Tax=Pelagicoccus sp. SDUM812003 TaxID=3041267 RepID=UPI00280D6DE5|nr:TonB-dependent receptor [Pelagicoccus sp. SDUM812003]MDQ8204063.1 TonB-dependent receptor [Pelagicoccus sp. SDUM812003]
MTPLAKAATGLAILGIAAGAVAQESSTSGMEVFETFTAVGQGESRANNSLNLEALEIAMPGALPEKMVDKVPGVNVVSRDPFGFYEFGNDIRVRAFSVANLGVTLDGVPVGTSDPRYGTPIGRMVDSANLTTIKVSQGAGDVTTPAYQALGGSLQYFTKDPSQEQGAYVSASYGSFDHISLFAKYETGEIVPGLTGYVSGSHFEFTPRGLDGLGKGLARRYEAKFKYEAPSDKMDITYAITYNDRDDYDTSGLDWQEWRDAEAGNYRGTGYGYREYTPFDFPNIDGGYWQYGDLSDQGRNLGPLKYIDSSLPAGEGVNAVYYNLWRNGRMDTLQRMKFDFDLDDGKDLSVVTYYQDKNNYGLWGRDNAYAQTQVRAAYSNDPDRTDIWAQPWWDAEGNAVSETGEIVDPYSDEHALVAPGTAAYTPAVYDEDGALVTPATTFVPGVPGRTGRDENFGGHRYGVTASYTWETENNKLIVGGWYEFDHHGTERPNYNLQDGGSILGWFNYDQFNFTNYTRYIDQDVMQYWIQDTFTTMDGRLDIIAGVKGIKLDRDARGFLSISEWLINEETQRSTTYDDYFLPQFGLLYTLNDNTELFFNYSENMATPNSGTITTAGDTFDPDILAPEYSDNFDIGVRGNIWGGNYTLQAYKIEYTDRILASAVPIDSANAGAAGNSRYLNVGGVDSWGVEASGDFNTGIEGLRISGSIALQETTFQEDLFDGFTDEEMNIPGSYRTEPNPQSTGPDDAYLLFQDIGGNDLGNTPFLTANFDVIYRKGQFRYNFGGKYFDDVYVNTFNTQPVDSYTVFDAGIAYSGKSDTPLEGWQVSLNVSNLFDQYFWYARSYNDEDGQVLADRGRNFVLKLETTF